MDKYLIAEAAYERLKEEYFKYGNLIIAYDFDNTVYDYHNTGERYDFIRKYLQENDIPFDSINEDAPHISFTGRKIYYNILLDDRAGLTECYYLLNRLYYDVICEIREE